MSNSVLIDLIYLSLSLSLSLSVFVCATFWEWFEIRVVFWPLVAQVADHSPAN